MSTSDSANEHASAKAAGREAFTVVGIAAGLGTLLASSCCVIPLALGSIGAGAGTFALLTFLQPYRAVLLAVSFIAIAAAWLYYLPRAMPRCETDTTCSAKPATHGSLIVLLFATALLCIAAFWTFFGTVLLQEVRGA